MNKIDLHIHGNYSSDSVLEYKELCKKAILCNYSHIAFTEHYDLIDTEITHYGLLPLIKYFKDIDEIRKDFTELNIIRGLELGEPHRISEFAKRLFKDFKPDYVIGSLHVTKNNINVSLPINYELSKQDITQYYEENLEMLETGGFDTLGHLGIYKRGLQNPFSYDDTEYYSVIDKIFKVMIKNNICLEVNNSGFKSKLKNHIPEPSLLKRYKDMGGELITISSDSHHIEHFDQFYNKTLDNLKSIGYSKIYFKCDDIWKSINI